MGRLPELAAELVRLKVNVIVPWFTPAAIAAKQATRDIPIICAVCGDMVGTGLVESLDRPGGNITGNSTLTAELAAKTVDLILEMIPSAKRIAALGACPNSRCSSLSESDSTLGYEQVFSPLEYRSDADFATECAGLRAERPCL